jgi:hypothetical protein
MSGWDLPPTIRSSVESALRSLSDNPDEKLIDVVDLNAQPLKALSFTLPDAQDAQSVYVFMFHVEFDRDGQTLHVLEGDYEHQTPNMDAKTPVL